MKNSILSDRILSAFFFALAILLPRQAFSSNLTESGKKQSALMKYEDKITEIISKMTIEEKVAMLHGKHMFSSEGVQITRRISLSVTVGTILVMCLCSILSVMDFHT